VTYSICGTTELPKPM